MVGPPRPLLADPTSRDAKALNLAREWLNSRVRSATFYSSSTVHRKNHIAQGFIDFSLNFLYALSNLLVVKLCRLRSSARSFAALRRIRTSDPSDDIAR
jgi:hypothetical protein